MVDMSITLSVLRPFSEDKKVVDWVSLECPGGSFVVSSGHQPLVNVLSSDGKVIYQQGGQEVELVVSAAGGLVHVVDNQVILFLYSPAV